MDESLNQSLSVKKPSKKIKIKKAKYTNLTIFLLLIHCATISIQKHLENNNMEHPENNKDYDYDKPRTAKDIFLVAEDICLTFLIIILLCKINNNLIILFSMLYFIIGIVSVFYFFLNKFCDIPEYEKIKDGSCIFFQILNSCLFFLEGYILFLCSEIIEKERVLVNREIYGYKN